MFYVTKTGGNGRKRTEEVEPICDKMSDRDGRMGMFSIDDVRIRAMARELKVGVGLRVWRWFGYMDRMDEGRCKTEVNGHRHRVMGGREEGIAGQRNQCWGSERACE